MITPDRSGSAPVGPDCSSAISAAPMAICANRSVRRASLGPSHAVGSKSCTTRLPSGAGPSSPCQNASRPMPHGPTTPSPVTTTRRELNKGTPLRPRASAELPLHEVEGLADGLDALELLLGHLDVERLLERHDELDEV